MNTKSEDLVKQEIELESKTYGCTLYRNNSGCFPNINNQLVRFGLGNTSQAVNRLRKSSDLIGFKTMVIGPHHIGKKVAVLTAIEVKKEGWKRNPNDSHENSQETFINIIKKAGGIGGFAQSVKDFITIMKR